MCSVMQNCWPHSGSRQVPCAKWQFSGFTMHESQRASFWKHG